MDRVLRTYAHTAWTPADPLAGLEPEVRRAILLMPSSFRERWKLAPWTSRHQRRLAISDIVAERRLMYELTHQNLAKATPEPAPTAPATIQADLPSPYYRYRLDLHRHAVGTMQQARSEQDRNDIATIPEAKADHDRRETRRNALLAVEIERAKLDVKELEILADRSNPPMVVDAPLPTRKPSPRKSKQQDRGR